MKGSPAPDVVVVGGGIVGASTALELCRLGLRTTLVDAGRPGRATDAGAGILSPETAPHPDEHWHDLATLAASHYRSLIADLEDDGLSTGYGVCGLLQVTIGAGEVPFFEEVLAASARRHPGAVTEIEPDEARRLFPLLGPVHRVALNAGAARVDGRVLTTALLDAARRAGCEQRFEAATRLVGRRGHVGAVALGHEELPCAEVVLCAGAWSGALAEALGARLAVGPMKGQILRLRLPSPHDAESGRWPIVQPVLGHYLVSWPDGQVACGGTLEAAAGFDTRPTAAGVHELLSEALKLAPGLGQASLEEVRVGLRPATADGAPFLGRLPGWDNVHLATGHGTDGLLLGPVSGLLAARSVAGLETPADLSTFAAGRFA